MIRKPSRSESDVSKLAEELRSRVRQGESIESWMRRHVGKLTRLVRVQGWRWEDVGTAMTKAGITYSTGRAWTPEMLRVKASEARAQIRARKARAGDLLAEPGAMLTTERQRPAPQPAEPSFAPVREQETERPKFALAQLVSRHEAPPKAPSQPQGNPAPAPATKQDADAVMKRFFGTDPSKE